jgi:RNA polymerase sigma-70 factor (ECF subfamily)
MTENDFQNLVDRQYVPLFRFALSLSKSETEAADLTQQTFFLGDERRSIARPLESEVVAIYDALSRISEPASP